ADVVHRADVRMIQHRCCPGFALKALERRLVVGEQIGEEFQSDRPAETRVLGFVHHSHAATTKLLQDAVVRDDFTLEFAGTGLRFTGLRFKRNRLFPSLPLLCPTRRPLYWTDEPVA